ncbi:hypothetical protein [Pseudomonas sp. T1.Ur]|uniref:hypothetical protein n=1 Tax=Pseudomonas sp. T1.Ur TaxID=2928704 RepID=UPI00201D62CD|nr:hypothetical protein [Pseudomonas sp. T1.Ur]MCL6702592.1 hypothetical protein [Pseudomonas sp. T1.Ur]
MPVKWAWGIIAGITADLFVSGVVGCWVYALIRIFLGQVRLYWSQFSRQNLRLPQ